MINLLGSSHVKWHEGAETSNRCFYGLGYLLCLITTDVHLKHQECTIQRSVNKCMIG